MPMTMPRPSLSKRSRDLAEDASGDESPSSSVEYAEEPFELYAIRVLRHLSKITPHGPPPPTVIRRRGGGYHRISELVWEEKGKVSGEETRLIWRSPRFRSVDVTRSASILTHLYHLHHPHLPVPLPLAYSGLATDVPDRYILMSHLPGRDLASVLDHEVLSVTQRLTLAERLAELIATIHRIPIHGAEQGLIGNACVDVQHHPSRLIVRTFPHNHEIDHDSASSPSASDQAEAEPHTLRSFILARLRLFLHRATYKGSPFGKDIYTRLIKVAHVLLDPDHLPAIDMRCQSVLVHTDLEPRNVLVQLDEGVAGNGGEIVGGGRLDGRSGKDQGNRTDRTRQAPSLPACSCPRRRLPTFDPSVVPTACSSFSPTTDERGLTITGVLDWDTVEALPPLVGYVSPNWVWDPTPTQAGDGRRTQTRCEDREDDRHPDEGIGSMDRVDLLIRDKFISSIEARIPDYMETVRQAKRRGLRRLMAFARTRVIGTWERKGVEQLERLAEEVLHSEGEKIA